MIFMHTKNIGYILIIYVSVNNLLMYLINALIIRLINRSIDIYKLCDCVRYSFSKIFILFSYYIWQLLEYSNFEYSKSWSFEFRNFITIQNSILLIHFKSSILFHLILLRKKYQSCHYSLKKIFNKMSLSREHIIVTKYFKMIYKGCNISIMSYWVS